MTTSRLLGIGAAVLALAAWVPGLTAQDDDRFRRLERMINELRQENAQLKGQVTQLQAQMDEGVSRGGGDLEQRLNDLEASISLTAPTTYRRGNLLRPGGFAENMFWGGEWRTRGDWRINTLDLDNDLDDEGFRLDYRFNLGVGFRWFQQNPEDSRVTTWFEIQASGRAANNTAKNVPPSNFSVGSFEAVDDELDVIRLYQAYLQLEDILGIERSFLRVGRQELAYGSFLFLGTNEFHTGTVHDAARFDVEFDWGSLSAFYSKQAASDGVVSPGFATGGLTVQEQRASGDEDELAGLYMEFDIEGIQPLKIDFYYFFFNGRGRDPQHDPENVTLPQDPAIDAFGRARLEGQLHTVGTWLRADDAGIDGLYLSLEVAYQGGEEEDDDSIDAFIIEFLAEYALPIWEDKDPRIFAGYYFAEGPDSERNSGATPLFIARHNNDPVHGGHGAYSRFGNIDLIPTQNIHVIQAGFKFRPDPSWIVGVTYLYAFFNHSAELLAANTQGNIFVDDRSFGHEIDVYAKYTLNAQTELFFNASVFIPEADFVVQPLSNAVPAGTFIEKNTDVAFGLYAQIQVRF